MIVYTRLWQTMKERNISQYKLEKEYGISNSIVDKLRRNANITAATLDRLCRILDCRIEDIAEYIPDPEKEKTHPQA